MASGSDAQRREADAAVALQSTAGSARGGLLCGWGSGGWMAVGHGRRNGPHCDHSDRLAGPPLLDDSTPALPRLERHTYVRRIHCNNDYIELCLFLKEELFCIS